MSDRTYPPPLACPFCGRAAFRISNQAGCDTCGISARCDSWNKRYHNPGSPDAVKAGCKCAVMDNCYGRGYHSGHDTLDADRMFVVSGNCPLHGDR